MIIIKNAHLVPELSEGVDFDEADVLLKDNVIDSIVPAGTAVADKEDTVIDADGQTLLPGLIDMHVHLYMGKSNTMDDTDRKHIKIRRALDALKFAQWYLDYGYTTVRDCGDSDVYSALAARNAINEGDYQGPRIYGSGLTITPLLVGFSQDPEHCAYINGPLEVRQKCREQFAHGADFIKLYGTGSMMSQESLPGRRIMEKDEVEAGVAAAKLRGTYVACHCHGAEAIAVMADAGVHTIEHSSFIQDAQCRKLTDKTDQGIVLTIACSSREANKIEGYDDRECDRYEPMNDLRRKCLRNAYNNYNILMGWGTDMSLKVMSANPFIEWQHRKDELGISNIDLLKQATVNSAKLMYLDDQLGTVKAGKLADLILVNGDPVTDIRAMYHKPVHVIKDGAIVR